MITDIPKITQRSIIAYSAVEGTPSTGEWYGCAVRRSFGVDSLTAATVRIVSGDSRLTTYTFDTNCRAVVDGSGIRIECKFTSTDSPGVSYGVEGHGMLTVEVTTAGDVSAGIAGATRQFTVKVLVLGHDMPYGSPNFLMFRVGESVEAALGASKIAKRDWITKEVGTGYGLSASGGQKIVGNTKVNGNYVESGLILHNRDGALSISGTAARPGVYRVFLDLLSSVQGFGEGEQVYHPFEGGYGESEVIIWIYRDWLPGDLVLLLPNPAGAEDRYSMKFDSAPGWSGLGDELVGVTFAREVSGDMVTWRGAKIYRHSGVVSSAYHYLIRCENATWKLYGKFTDSDTAPAVADMTLLATASARGFDDETPPKSGWSVAGLLATGEAQWYLPPPEAGQTDNSGWYAYAGRVTLTPPEEDAEPVTVEVFARQPHVIPQYAGWNLGTTSGTAARYLAHVGGAWHVTSDVSDLSGWSDIAACTKVSPQRSDSRIAIPFCPAKLGDVGLPVEISPPEGSATEPVTVLHSLSNSFAGSGELALLMDGIAGAMWKRYPVRRLLSLFSVSATVTMSISSSESITECSESHNPDGNMPEHDNSGDYDDGVPSVAEIKAAGGAITVSQVEHWEKVQTAIRAEASGSVSFSLAYALWSDGFPKYLEAILGRSSSGSGVTASYSHNRVVSGKQASSSKTWRVGEVETSGGSGGESGGDGEYEITSGSASVTWKHWAPEIMDYDEIETASFIWQNGQYVADGDDHGIGSMLTLMATVTAAGMVTVSAYNGDGTVTATAQGTATASGNITGPRQEQIPETGDYEDIEANDFEITITATATQGGGGGGTEEVAYVAAETLGGTAYQTAGDATTASGNNKKAHGTATVYFGEGRECNWPHRAVCAAAGGEGGMSVDFSATDQQRRIATTTTNGGQRHRGGPRDAWTYDSGNEQTWGTTTTTTATDTDLPETLTDSLAHGGTFHTGVLALVFAAAMGSLSATYSTTDGSAEGYAFGYRQNPQTGEDESANIPSVSGSWTYISASSTNGPGTRETRGNDVSASIDLSGEIDGDEWEQWGYGYSKTEHTTRVSVQIAITDADYPAPAEN